VKFTLNTTPRPDGFRATTSKSETVQTKGNTMRKEIRSTRRQYGLTQLEAADLVSVCLRTWQNWESGSTRMPKSAWQLFLIKLQEQPIPPF